MVKRIGLIIASTRTPRLGPSIAVWLVKTLTPLNPGIRFAVVDLAEITLPVSPVLVPIHLPTPLAADAYPSAEVNAWSKVVASLDGFIFLTPQYNWSIPASLKIALDNIYHEWVGKPGLIVSYGGRGGGKAAEHLKEILKALKIQELEGNVELPTRVNGVMAAEAGTPLSAALLGSWEEQGKVKELQDRWAELGKIFKEKENV